MYIFICYSRQNLDAVKSLVQDLEAVGNEVWFDQVLTGGQDWWDKILGRIRECDLFVFALSPETPDSYACKLEYSYASNLHKRILPVLIADGVSINQLPPALSKIQYLDYRHPDKQTAFALINTLNILPGPQELPDPLPEPPEAPISILGKLKNQIDSTSSLSFEEQTVLVFNLKNQLKESETPTDVLNLIRRLRNRNDLYVRVAEEIGEVLASKEARTRETPTRESLRTTSPTVNAKKRLKGTHLAAIWLGCSAGFALLSAIFFDVMYLTWFGPGGVIYGVLFGALVGIVCGIFVPLDIRSRIFWWNRRRKMIREFHLNQKFINILAYYNSLDSMRYELEQVFNHARTIEEKENLQAHLQQEIESEDSHLEKRFVCARLLFKEFKWRVLIDRDFVPPGFRSDNPLDPDEMIKASARFIKEHQDQDSIKATLNEKVKEVLNKFTVKDLIINEEQRKRPYRAVCLLVQYGGYESVRLKRAGFLPKNWPNDFMDLKKSGRLKSKLRKLFLPFSHDPKEF